MHGNGKTSGATHLEMNDGRQPRCERHECGECPQAQVPGADDGETRGMTLKGLEPCEAQYDRGRCHQREREMHRHGMPL